MKTPRLIYNLQSCITMQWIIKNLPNSIETINVVWILFGAQQLFAIWIERKAEQNSDNKNWNNIVQMFHHNLDQFNSH